MTHRTAIGFTVIALVLACFGIVALLNRPRPVDCAAIADAVALRIGDNPAANGQPIDRQRVVDACEGKTR